MTHNPSPTKPGTAMEAEAQGQFAAFRAVNIARCSSAFFPLEHWSPMQWGCALGGECGEALNVLKKIERDGLTPERVKAVASELSDIITYADLTAARLGIELWPALVETFNRVSDRVGSHIKIDASLATAPQAATVDREGWVLVPRAPTEAMVASGWIDKEDVNPDDIYRAMLAAAPTAPEHSGGADDERRLYDLKVAWGRHEELKEPDYSWLLAMASRGIATHLPNPAPGIAARLPDKDVCDGWESTIRAVCDSSGKRWRLEGDNFVMQPVGEITAYEAECLCRQIARSFSTGSVAEQEAPAAEPDAGITDADVTRAYQIYSADIGLDEGTSGLLRAKCASGLRAVLEDWNKTAPAPRPEPTPRPAEVEKAYFPSDLKGADLLDWIVGYYGPKIPKALGDKLFELAQEWHVLSATQGDQPAGDAS